MHQETLGLLSIIDSTSRLNYVAAIALPASRAALTVGSDALRDAGAAAIVENGTAGSGALAILAASPTHHRHRRWAECVRRCTYYPRRVIAAGGGADLGP